MSSFSFCEVLIVLKFTLGQMDYFPIFAKIFSCVEESLY